MIDKSKSTLVALKAAALVAFTMAAAMTCEDPPSGPETQLEHPAIGPTPPHQANDVPTSPTLAWSSLSTSEASPNYDLYLDTVNPPGLLKTGLTDTFFAPDLLGPGQTYYWRVVSRGARGFPVSPLWSFRTKSIRYPLRVGDWWEYSKSLWFENIKPERLIQDFGDTVRATVAVQVTDFLVGTDALGVYEFHHTLVPPSDRTEGYNYYEERGDGLYNTWESGVDLGVSLKRADGTRYVFAGRTFGSTEELFAFLEDGLAGPTTALSGDQASRKSLQYPLRVGEQWTYLQSDEVLWRIDCKVVDWRQVKIGSVSYDCFVIQHLYDLNKDGIWDDDVESFDYIAAQGLVKRTTSVHGVVLADWSHADGIGTADLVSEANLIGLDVQLPEVAP